MKSVKQHVKKAIEHLNNASFHLDRVTELDGARNPDATYNAVRNVIIRGELLAHDLTPLRCRLALQLSKKEKAKKAGKAVK